MAPIAKKNSMFNEKGEFQPILTTNNLIDSGIYESTVEETKRILSHLVTKSDSSGEFIDKPWRKSSNGLKSE